MTETVQVTKATEPMVVKGCYFLDPIERYLICLALRSLRPNATREVRALLDRLRPTEEEKAANEAYVAAKIRGE